MDLIVAAPDTATWGDRTLKCALGRAGISADKREGDGTTPAGRFPLRQVFYRPDRLDAPATALPLVALGEDLGWCDDPESPDYNRLVALPFGAGHERLWRDDGLYDLFAVLGHNDDPVAAGAGSAIFLHAAAPDFAPTEGCVALALADLTAVLAEADETSCVEIIAAT